MSVFSLAPRADGRTWVKVCGLSDPTHAEIAAAAGADAIGVVLHPPSPRDVTISQAAAVVVAVADIPVVAVTVNRSVGELVAIVEGAGVRAVQLHGDESAEEIAAVRAALPEVGVLRARRIDPDVTTWPVLTAEGADGIVVDAAVPWARGGTGTPLKWQQPDADAPIILAGGLEPRTVATAIDRVHPFGVDVSSGVESAPGVKDPDLIRSFLDAVRRAP